VVVVDEGGGVVDVGDAVDGAVAPVASGAAVTESVVPGSIGAVTTSDGSADCLATTTAVIAKASSVAAPAVAQRRSLRAERVTPRMIAMLASVSLLLHHGRGQTTAVEANVIAAWPAPVL
jgi:hypothetical protein